MPDLDLAVSADLDSKYDAGALIDELLQMQTVRKMEIGFAAYDRLSLDGRKVFIAACGNGYHESFESHEHALFLLVDSFRTRPEDTEAVYMPIMAWQGGTIEDARKRAAELAKQGGDVLLAIDEAKTEQLAANADADEKRADNFAKQPVKKPQGAK